MTPTGIAVAGGPTLREDLRSSTVTGREELFQATAPTSYNLDEPAMPWKVERRRGLEFRSFGAPAEAFDAAIDAEFVRWTPAFAK